EGGAGKAGEDRAGAGEGQRAAEARECAVGGGQGTGQAGEAAGRIEARPGAAGSDEGAGIPRWRMARSLEAAAQGWLDADGADRESGDDARRHGADDREPRLRS